MSPPGLLSGGPTTGAHEGRSNIKPTRPVRRYRLAGRDHPEGGTGKRSRRSAALLLDGSSHADVWGADWLPTEKAVELGALINVRPAQGNRGIEIQSAELRSLVERIVRAILGGIEP